MARSCGCAPGYAGATTGSENKTSVKREVVQAFTAGACDVLVQELGALVTSHVVRLEGGLYTTGEITVVIGLLHEVEGFVLLGLSKLTALRYIAKAIMPLRCKST